MYMTAAAAAVTASKNTHRLITLDFDRLKINEKNKYELQGNTLSHERAQKPSRLHMGGWSYISRIFFENFTVTILGNLQVLFYAKPTLWF